MEIACGGDWVCRIVKRLLDEKIDSDGIIEIIDLGGVDMPSLLHSNLHQLIWIRDHKWDMGYDEHRAVDIYEGTHHYEDTQSIRFHKFYTEKYIFPILNYKEFSKLNDGRQDFVFYSLERLYKEFPANELYRRNFRDLKEYIEYFRAQKQSTPTQPLCA